MHKVDGEVNWERYDILIERSKIIHNNKYCYSKSKESFINDYSKIKIICPNHGEFEQCIRSHSRGNGCRKCYAVKDALSKRYPFSYYLDKFKTKHGNYYNYSESESTFKNAISIIKIICPKHGAFYQTINSHGEGHGCFHCESCVSLEEYLEKCAKIHNGKYSYANVKSLPQKCQTKISIICPKHGEFIQPIYQHAHGTGCDKCGKETHLKPIEYWIEKSNNIYGVGKFDYSKSHINFKNGSRSKIEIICKKHGSFYKTFHDHTRGKGGCPKCKQSFGESKIDNFLTKNHFQFEIEKKFNDCRSPETNKLYRFDFYIPSLHLCIEYDGKQHREFSASWNFSSKEAFLKTQKRDSIKNKYCLDNNIKLIRISDLEDVDEKLTRELLPLLQI